MGDRRATKDHFERENDEAERLVRPAPKVKPPRHDKRRELIEPDKDPDSKPDKDLSMNRKDIGGSVGGRVVNRWLQRQADELDITNKVKVRHKDTGWVGYVNKDTLKEKGSEYEKVEPEGEEKSDSGSAPEVPKPHSPEEPKPESAPPHEDNKQLYADFGDEMKEDPYLESFAKSLFSKDPKSLGGFPNDFPLEKAGLLKKFPVLEKFKFKTIGDVRKAIHGAKSAPHGKPSQKVAPAEKKQEGPKAPESQVSPEKQKAVSDAGQQIRELAEKDPALKTVVHQIDGQDPNSLYQLRNTINPAEDISKSVSGLPSGVKSVGDLVDALQATKPEPEKKEPKPRDEDRSEDAVNKLVETVQKALGVSPREEMHPDDKAEVDEFLKSKIHETPEFKEWASKEYSTSEDDDGNPLFFDEKRRKHVPFDRLSDEEKYSWKERFEEEQNLQANLQPLKEMAEKDPHFSNLLKDLSNPDSELSESLEKKLGEHARYVDLKKSIPELKNLDLPKGVRTVGDLIDAAHEIHKPAPKIPRRKVTEAEKDKATRQLIENFPVEVAAKFRDMDLHPDDVRDLVENYNTAKLHAKDGELTDLVKETGYETDPSKVRPPSVGVDSTGQEVPFAKLHPKEQAAALQKHQMFVVAMSLAAREQEVDRLEKKTGAPRELLGAIADTTLGRRPGETEEDHLARAKESAKHIFADAVKRGIMGEDTDRYARWQAKRDKLIEKHEERAKQEGEEYDPELDEDLPPPPSLGTVKQIGKLLKHFDGDPAAQQIAVGWSQAADYLSARHDFLDPDSPDAISEHQTPRDIANKVRRMGEFFDERAKEYPENMRDLVPAKESLRERVVEKIRTLAPEKFPFVKKLVQEQEYDDYEDSLKRWEFQHKKYEKEQAKKQKKDPYREKGESSFPEPPRRPEGYLQSRGSKEDLKKNKNELFDRYRRQMGVANTDKTAHLLWSVVDRSRKHSICKPIRTMGDSVSRVAERAKQAVYWGVEPYPKGHEGFAPYVGWGQVHQRDLGDKDFDTILKSAREWLKAPVLSSAIDGIYRDTQLRAALDLALRSCENGKYSVGLQPPLYNMLLAKLGGHSQTDTLLTDRSNIKGPITVAIASAHPNELSELEKILKENGYDPKDAKKLNEEGMGPHELEHRIKSTPPGASGSLEYTHRIHKVKSSSKSPYAPPSGEEKPMKTAARIRQLAVKYASNPALAYDLVELSDKIAQEEGQEPAQQDQKQGGQVPPQFLEHMKKKEDGKEEKKEDGQSQQKDAAYHGLRSAVIRLAHANPQLRAAYQPLLETIKKLG
jgi:hypothetical protein